MRRSMNPAFGRRIRFVSLVMMTMGAGWGGVVALGAGCGRGGSASEDENPFLEGVEGTGGKADTGWISALNAPEVEVTMEGDVALRYRSDVARAPVDLAQFALTNLRKNSNLYVESLLQVGEADRTIEWRVDGTWIPESAVDGVDLGKLGHFRIRGVNAIVLRPEEGEVLLGKRYDAVVPVTPYRIYTDHGNICSRGDHGELWDSCYWYTWAPDRDSCTIDKGTMTVTLDQVYDAGVTRYPEYDRLIEDGEVTMVVFFGKVSHDDGPIEEDLGYRTMESFMYKLKQAEFVESTSPDGLRRFTKEAGGVTQIVDISGPEDFEGLNDYAHSSTFRTAVQHHEVVVYNGHSILGASPMWSDMSLYPAGYQVFFFNGCLGYEYYMKFILEGKQTWSEVDVISNIVETPVAPQGNVIAAFASAIFEGASGGGHVSWQQILDNVNHRTYNSYYGVSGARTNCFSPSGSLCEDVTGATYENDTAVPIPDNDPQGVGSTIEVTDSLTVGTVQVAVDITHPWTADLKVVLSHGGVEAVLWDHEGGHTDDVRQTFTPRGFTDQDASGIWTLTVTDSVDRDQGTLNHWSLTISSP